MERVPEDKAVTVPLGILCSTAYQLQAQTQPPTSHRLLRPIKMSLLSVRINGFRTAETVENINHALISPSFTKAAKAPETHNTSGVSVFSYQALICRQN